MRKPNIALVVIDTAKASHFGCYGYEKNTSQYIDSLAKEGFKFEDAYAPCCWTLPSHVSMFASKDLHEHGITTMGQSVEDVDLDLFDWLEENGYTRYGFSSNYVMSERHDWHKRFDKFEFFDTGERGDNVVVSKASEIRSGYNSVYRKYAAAFGKSVRENGVIRTLRDSTEPARRALFLNDSGARQINERVSKELMDEPFFLYVNYMEVHQPYKAPGKHSQMFQDRPRYLSIIDALGENLKKYNSAQNKPDPKLKKILTGLYDGAIHYVDQKVKELHKHLEDKYGDTVLIVTSDHGEYLLEKGQALHMSGLDPEVTEVPMIVYGAEKGSESEPVSLKQLPKIVKNIPEIDYDSGAVRAEFAGMSSVNDNMGTWITDEELEKYDAPVIAGKENSKYTMLRKGFFDLAEAPEFLEIQFPVKVNVGDTEEEVKEKLAELGYN